MTQDTIAAGILAAATELPGESWTKIRAKVKGSHTQAAEVRDRLLKDGALRNAATVDGWFNLWVAADPAATRSALRTGSERLPLPSPEGEPPSEPFPVPPIRERGTERLDRGRRRPGTAAATDIGREVA